MPPDPGRQEAPLGAARAGAVLVADQGARARLPSPTPRYANPPSPTPRYPNPGTASSTSQGPVHVGEQAGEYRPRLTCSQGGEGLLFAARAEAARQSLCCE